MMVLRFSSGMPLFWAVDRDLLIILFFYLFFVLGGAGYKMYSMKLVFFKESYRVFSEIKGQRIPFKKFLV